MLEVALRYGSALFSLAKEENKIDSWQKEMRELRNILDDNKEFISVLCSAFLSHEERKEMLAKVITFEDEELNSFLKVIIDNNRFDLIIDILYAFNTLCNNTRGIIEGIVYSVEPLTRDTLNRIQEKISSKEKQKIELKNVIDKSLIGGLKVAVNDHVYDDSIKFHLNEMKSTLIK